MFAVTTCFGYYCMSQMYEYENMVALVCTNIAGKYNALDARNVFSNAPIYLSKSWKTGCQPLPRSCTILSKRSKVQQPVFFGELPRNNSAIGQ